MLSSSSLDFIFIYGVWSHSGDTTAAENTGAGQLSAHMPQLFAEIVAVTSLTSCSHRLLLSTIKCTKS